MNLETLIVKLHPASVHFPIALLLLASFTALLYLYWRRLPILLTLTWPLLWLGWLGAIVACLTGLLAQSGLPPQAPYRSVLNWHITTGLAQVVIFAALLYQRWRYPMLTKQRRKRIGLVRKMEENRDLLDDASATWWITLLLLLGMGLVVASGWNGGRLVFEWGVNVISD